MLALHLQTRKDPDPEKKPEPCNPVNSVPVDYDLAVMVICPSGVIEVLKWFGSAWIELSPKTYCLKEKPLKHSGTDISNLSNFPDLYLRLVGFLLNW